MSALLLLASPGWVGCGSTVGTGENQSAVICDPLTGLCSAPNAGAPSTATGTTLPPTTTGGATPATGSMPQPTSAPPVPTPPPAGAAGAPTTMEGTTTLEGGAVQPTPTEPIEPPFGMNPEEMPEDMMAEDVMAEDMMPEDMMPEPTLPDDVVGDIPDLDYCAPTEQWDMEWAAWEYEVLELVNEYRAQGADCGSQGSFDAAGPLSMDENLRCAARVHSLDMYERGFFEHTNPDGDDPGDRMDAAGYEGRAWGENIAMGQRSPMDVVDGWMDSDGHCSNIMNDRYTLIGVGYHPGDEDSFRNANYWTQTFGG